MKKNWCVALLSFIMGFTITAPAFAQKTNEGTIKEPPVPTFKKDTINIIKFGAVGDGQTLNTVFINNAISQLSSKGGGVVLIPKGLWLTGPIVLKSNINTIPTNKNSMRTSSCNFIID